MIQKKSYMQKQTKGTQELLKTIKAKLRCIGMTLYRTVCPFENEIYEAFSTRHKSIAQTAFYTTLSFLLSISRLSLGICPFGLCILCMSVGKMSLFCYIGASIGCLFFGGMGLIRFVVFSLIFLLRKSITDKGFNEKLPYRLVLAFLSSLFLGSVSMFTKPVDAPALLCFFTFVTLCTLCSYLFWGFLGKSINKTPSALYTLSVYSLILCVIPAFNRFSFNGLDTGLLFVCIMTMYIAKHKGAVYACCAGFIFGFACTNPLYSVSCGMGGLFCGYLFSIGSSLSPAAFFLSFMFCRLYLFGAASLFSILPILCASVLIFAAIHNYVPNIFLHIKTEKPKPAAKKDNTLCEFEKVSDSLSGLSALIYKFAEHMKAPSFFEAGKIFDSAFSEVCKSCSMSEMCYAKRECNLSAVKKNVIASLQRSPLKQEDLSKNLLCKCIKTRELCSYINEKYSELHFMTMKSNRTATVAGLYSSMSRLIKSTAGEQKKSVSRDERLENELARALKKIGVEFDSIFAYGAREKEIEVHGLKAEKIPCSAKDLAEYLSEECSIQLCEPTFDISLEGNLVMKIERKSIIKVQYAQCQLAKEDDDVSGDTLQFFETDKDYFYALIADGMGSGRTAAATSRLSCVFLEKMLRTGTSKNVCLEMLNNLLLSKNDETFSGIDLLEIDKICARAYFIKAGAAPSFVLRQSNLYKITSMTPPVGIIPAFSAESTRFALEKGDVIIMVSDGIITGESDGLWLSKLIRLDEENEPALLAKRLIEKACETVGRKDDMSACVIKIE